MKTLKMKIHVFLINVHLKKLLQNSIVNINARRSISVIDTTMKRIRKNLMSKKKRKSKLRMISLQTKRRWMRKHLKKTKTTRNQSYIATSWMNFSKMIIESNKTRTSQSHSADHLNLRWQTYFDESEKNENIIVAAMNFNWNKKKRLKDVDIMITHHDELEELIMIVEELINHCERTTDARDKIYKIYFDNQVSLKAIHVISSMFNQKRLQRVQAVINKTRDHETHLTLHWIFEHANIENNEMIDKIIKKAHNFSLSSSKRLHHEVTTRMNFIRDLSWKIWDRRWRKETKEVQYRELASKMNHRHLKKHSGRLKTHSALIIQLKINKIEFNKFLHEKRVFGVMIAHCQCDENYMTIKHVLLSCSKWREERRKMLQKTKITNMKRLLNERKAVTAAMCMILTTNLLNQFQATEPSKEKKTSHS